MHIGTSRADRARQLQVLFAAALILGLSSLALGQASDATVKGSGTATLSRPADHLLLEVQVRSKGKDVKEALAKLQQDEASIKQKLTEFPDGEVRFEPPHADSDDSPQKAYARMMAAAMNQANGRRKAGPQGVTLLASLKASWPIKGEGADAVVQAAYELQEKLRAAAPWKPAAPAKGDPAAAEEQEEAEESAGSANNPFAAAVPKPGQPVFSFAVTFTPQERAKASADAFGRAREQAAALASAAGKVLGDVRTIEREAGAAPSSDSATAMAEYIATLQGMAQNAKPSAAPGVTVGNEPGAVAEQVTVTATFSIR